MPRVLVIINPVSGPARRGGAARRVGIARHTLERLGAQANVRLTERVGHAYELGLEAAAAGVELVIAWGGDGTINEVGRALVQHHAEAMPGEPASALGIIPGGSGNGLARELKIPFDPAQAFERALGADVRQVDAGMIGDRFFFNVAGVGLDSHIAALVSTRVHHRGLLPYLKATGRDLLKYRPVDYRLQIDGRSFQTSALLVAIANSKQYGFGAHIAPGALIDDGLMDVVIVEDRGLIGNVARIPSLFTRRLDRREGVTAAKARGITIRSERPMLFHVDGEAIQGSDTLIARVHPRVLRLRA